jgi:hypothetical protein
MTAYLLVCIALYALAAAPPSYADNAAARERARIYALLDALERSGLVFIRNGSAHTAQKARVHLEMKLDRSGGRVTTAEQFIDRLASRSSATGRPYLVRLADGSTVEAGIWLRARLAEIDTRRKAAEQGTP